MLENLKGVIAMTLEELEARIKVLEDIEAIKRLKGKYGYFVDTRNWQEFMNLIMDDAIWDFGSLGLYKGKEEILRFTRDIILDTYSFMMHNFFNIFVEVQGNKATGEWYFLVPATNDKEKRAEWLAGKYEEEYVKVNGAWKFKKVTARINFIAPYDEGWAKAKTV